MTPSAAFTVTSFTMCNNHPKRYWSIPAFSVRKSSIYYLIREDTPLLGQVSTKIPETT